MKPEDNRVDRPRNQEKNNKFPFKKFSFHDRIGLSHLTWYNCAMKLFETVRSLFQPRKRFATICVALIIFAFFSRIWRVEYPSHFYFDEIYHAFTAQRFLHNDPKGYEFWNTPPAGVAYEWTHPPVAKLLMALGMLVFGENSFGWRISSVLFGTGIVFLVGRLAWIAFHDKRITLLALFFAAIDELLIAMSRIAMNDVHVIFFILASVIVYIKFKRMEYDSKVLLFSKFKTLAICVVFLGLALASKWTALYLIPAYGIDQILTILTKRKIPALPILLLAPILSLFLVVGVYLASYTQFFLQGHSFPIFIQLQQQMWWYHTGLKATHAYQSRPEQWLLDIRPVWLFVDYAQYAKGYVANIYNTDNPFLLWGGLASILFTASAIILKVVRVKKTKEYALHVGFFPQPWEVYFFLLLYFILWVPWIFSPRIMFFYHYAPSLPFLFILLARTCVKLWEHGRNSQALIKGFLVLIVIAFLAIYPLNSGLFIPISYTNTLFTIFPTWR